MFVKIAWLYVKIVPLFPPPPSAQPSSKNKNKKDKYVHFLQLSSHFMLFSCFSFHALLQPIYRWDGGRQEAITDRNQPECVCPYMCVMDSHSALCRRRPWFQWNNWDLNVAERLWDENISYLAPARRQIHTQRATQRVEACGNSSTSFIKNEKLHLRRNSRAAWFQWLI